MSTRDEDGWRGLREKFATDGFAVLPGYFSSERIDATAAAIDRLLNERAEEIVVDDQQDGRRSVWADASGRETQHFKFNDLYLLSKEVRQIALEPKLARVLALLLGDEPVLCNSLNFAKGSGDAVHIDSLFMTPQTPHALIATWTAWEDVHPDSGPLSYYPGSHKIPLYTFRDGSHHLGPGERDGWTRYIREQLRERGLKEQVFHAKKGDVFIWHSDLVHAGSPIRDRARTRRSLVCHYYTAADCRRMGCQLEAEGDAYWMRRLPQAVLVDPQAFRNGRRFPEENYLERYPDIKAAVAAGSLPSGQLHYETFGYKEGRGV